MPRSYADAERVVLDLGSTGMGAGQVIGYNKGHYIVRVLGHYYSNSRDLIGANNVVKIATKYLQDFSSHNAEDLVDTVQHRRSIQKQAREHLDLQKDMGLSRPEIYAFMPGQKLKIGGRRPWIVEQFSRMTPTLSLAKDSLMEQYAEKGYLIPPDCPFVISRANYSNRTMHLIYLEHCLGLRKRTELPAHVTTLEGELT